MPHSVPDTLPAADRRREVAKLLAIGFLRHHRRLVATSAISTESEQNRLDECGQTRLHAFTRSTGERSGDPENAREAGTHE